MRIRLLPLVLSAFLASSACRARSGEASDADAPPLGSWRLVQLEGVELASLGEAPELTIGADGSLAGYGGVNRFAGKADAEELRHGRLRAGPLLATRRAGPPAAMAAEASFLALLGAPLEWRRSGRALELLQDGAVKARLVPPERP